MTLKRSLSKYEEEISRLSEGQYELQLISKQETIENLEKQLSTLEEKITETFSQKITEIRRKNEGLIHFFLQKTPSY